MHHNSRLQSILKDTLHHSHFSQVRLAPPADSDTLTTSQIYRILLHVFLLRPSMLALLVMSLLHLKCCTTRFRSRSEHLNRPPFKLMAVISGWYDAIGRL